jgi:hypothetical protein
MIRMYHRIGQGVCAPAHLVPDARNIWVGTLWENW